MWYWVGLNWEFFFVLEAKYQCKQTVGKKNPYKKYVIDLENIWWKLMKEAISWVSSEFSSCTFLGEGHSIDGFSCALGIFMEPL